MTHICKTCPMSRVSNKGTLFCRIRVGKKHIETPCRDVIYCQLEYGPFNFSQALQLLKEGWPLTRKEWYYLLHTPEDPQPLLQKEWSQWFKFIEMDGCNIFGTLKTEQNPIYISSPDGETVEWTPTQEDILAEDWYLKECESMLEVFNHALSLEEERK